MQIQIYHWQNCKTASSNWFSQKPSLESIAGNSLYHYQNLWSHYGKLFYRANLKRFCKIGYMLSYLTTPDLKFRSTFFTGRLSKYRQWKWSTDSSWSWYKIPAILFAKSDIFCSASQHPTKKLGHLFSWRSV